MRTPIPTPHVSAVAATIAATSRHGRETAADGRELSRDPPTPANAPARA
jgi:hypothetical protein